MTVKVIHAHGKTQGSLPLIWLVYVTGKEGDRVEGRTLYQDGRESAMWEMRKKVFYSYERQDDYTIINLEPMELTKREIKKTSYKEIIKDYPEITL